ncbi:Smr/MutS family protein [Desulforhopalus singaporensis]|uniref:Smr domain-containing protein n=1 Tax=Desulforhopalus singaporensis TaxID=91360 RepID=A0A1H0RDK3_9BACT|nr:Smr/MutS family protein [Desulforhopalus singaporensis]SDP27614.1 Smr domain-containing protein [Desulforhopalus singaporensis]
MIVSVCDVCGNEIENGANRCPYCGAHIEGGTLSPEKSFRYRTVNLEAGRPVAEVALHRMVEAIDDCRRNGVTVVTFIHGYGSSGKGGIIRSECRKMLDYMENQGRIGGYIPGEEFNKRSGATRAFINRFPQLGKNKNLNRGNRGITLVILS